MQKNKTIMGKRGNAPARVFIGWHTVLAAGIMGLWGYGLWIYSFGTIFKPLEDEFGWTRAEISGAGSVRALEAGVLPYGLLVDKWGPRAMSLIGILLAGLGCILMYFVNSLWSFYLVFGIIVSTGFGFALTSALDKAIAEWFVKRRGLALSIFRVIVACEIIPPFVTWLIIQYGWRGAFIIAGLITWAIGLPLSWFFIKPHRPEYYGLLPDGLNIDAKEGKDRDSILRFGQELVARTHGEVEFTLRQALKTRGFWAITLTRAFTSLAMPIITMHQIPYLIGIGIDPIIAASTMSFVVITGIPGRIFGGILADKLPAHKLKYILFLSRFLDAIGLFFLITATDLTFVYLFVLLYGLGHGFDVILDGLIRARFFGRKAFGSIQAISSMVTFPVNLISPIYIGWSYDVNRNYKSCFTTILILFVIGLLGNFFIDPPKRKPDISSDIKKFI